MQTIQEVSKETLQIENFLKAQSEGAELTYIKVEKESGVKMDLRGKAFLRSALKRLKIPYETFHGQGIRLLCSDNATRIVAHKTIKIDNATKRAEKTTKMVIKSTSFEKVDIANRQRIEGLASLFATIRNFSNTAKKIFSNQAIKIGEQIGQ